VSARQKNRPPAAAKSLESEKARQAADVDALRELVCEALRE